ncbi:RICIN domain-containing protein [Streptomyces sp. AC627_RSS907]|uniref:RICIN domain-containing protein n=1 Tax=Streptomyces sp. AC627_RSS907 TaxID=2823684 RepID=UPI001C26F407|nr:ricin-type beta-trefoil lectin domain protein [Streptomyces sp. AC627_RSS907]
MPARTADGAPLLSTAARGCPTLTRTSALTVAACDGTSAQRWSLTGGTLRSGDLCARVPARAVGDGTPVTTAPCDGSAGRRFRRSGHALIAAVPDLCVDLSGGAAGSGAVLSTGNGRDTRMGKLGWGPVLAARPSRSGRDTEPQ